MKVLLSAFALVGLVAVGSSVAEAADAVYCDGYARNFANKRAGGNAIGGAVLGGIGGAVFGGILGGNRGAGIGAATGAATGAVVGGSTWQRYYNQAYYGCLNSGGGPRVQPIYAPSPYATASVYTTVNLRAGPGTNFGIIGKIFPGQRVNVGSCDPQWCSVGTPAGGGWASRTFLQFGG
jgi:hypothetical protein